MCGFAGLLTTRAFTRDALVQAAARMSDALVHRGPDDSGAWVDERAGVALGFRRLAILDVSPAGHQPMVSRTGRFVVAFNGEVYNYAELRKELEPIGHRFAGGSDTEVMLAAFEQWGIRRALPRFVGMFAMAVWDADRRELSLVRDRLGKKPLYVRHEHGLVTFGSELKALAAGPAFDRTIDREALAAYMRYLYVPAPRTIFRDTSKVPAAHVLTLRAADARCPDPEPYWSVEDAALTGLRNPVRAAPEDVVDELDRLVSDAVRCRMRADVPVGALLSGGVDSSTVVALMQEASARPIRTYTVGFAEQDFDESAYAAAVARHLGTDHAAIRLSAAEACATVPAMAEIFDEPLADPSQLPTFLISRFARRDVTVALCGDGGDELFGGYNRYVYGARLLPRLTGVPRVVRRALAAGLGCVPPRAWSRARQLAAAVAPHLPAQRVEERVEKLRHLMAARSSGDMYRSLLSAWQHPETVVDAGGAGGDRQTAILERSEPANLLDRMMLADQMTYLPDDLLAKVDRASMAVSLEVRAPLLDHRVVEFSWRIPRTLKLRGSRGKWILRQVLHRRVPPALIERPKMGFSVPIEAWLRGPLRAWAQDVLFTGTRHEDGLNHRTVARAWAGLQAGSSHAAAAVWAVVMYRGWRTRWVS